MMMACLNHHHDHHHKRTWRTKMDDAYNVGMGIYYEQCDGWWHRYRVDMYHYFESLSYY